MDYYKKKLFIPRVDRNDNIIGRVERWEAHKKAILHRGFTVVLVCQDKLVVQHRHHPVFDGVFDLSFSSHQIYLSDGSLQSPTEAMRKTFQREWQIEEDIKIYPKKIGAFYYRKKDPNSVYTEHEINYVYMAKIDKLPLFNPLFAYGVSFLDKKLARNKKFPLSRAYAPWVEAILSLL